MWKQLMGVLVQKLNLDVTIFPFPSQDESYDGEEGMMS
jgi:hypothetical protein